MTQLAPSTPSTASTPSASSAPSAPAPTRASPPAGRPTAAPGDPDRLTRRQLEKFAERRAQLASSALLTLSELGYARTSLRDIAQNADFSHGVLHYYFRDKLDLITEGVRQYKAVCVLRYDDLIEHATTPDALRRGFGATMADTLVNDAPMHRLWYDLRSQSFFEPGLREDVVEIDGGLERMIWRVVARFAELSELPPTVGAPVAYGMFDGVFQQSLLKYSFGSTRAAPELSAAVEHLLDSLLLRP